jgi:hypothetical protein
MTMVQAAIVRAVSGLDDSLGISTLTPVVRTVGLCAIGRMQLRTDLLPDQAHPAGELLALFVNLISPASGRSEARTNDDLSSREQWSTPCSRSRMSRFATTLRSAKASEGS